ncbi:MAG: hypothetical protein CM15mP69_4590 [Ectothiorhodospiraceae bacterium]|nr:MAG: hypothetical protein CM15mP69_4590 [Ectothiorhodospiraceae bacterium]
MINIISNIFENRKKGFIVGISSVSGGEEDKRIIYMVVLNLDLLHTLVD